MPGSYIIMLIFAPRRLFALVMAVETVVTGCPKFSNLSYEAKFTDIFLNITIDDYTVDLRDAPRNPHYECEQTYQIPQAEIILSRDELAAKNTQQIHFETGTPYENFDIELLEYKVRLIPSAPSQIYKALKLSHVVNTLTHWFYPEGTIILYLPEASSDNKKLEEAIADVAEKHGLVPLTSIYPDFRSPISTPYHYYYVDQIGKTVSKIEKTGDGYLDKIHIGIISYELEEDVPALKEMVVYAKKPGMYE